MATTVGGEPDEFRDLLTEHSDEVADLTRQLRVAVLTARPELSDKIYVGWHGLGLHHPDEGYVAALFPRAHEVHVGFEHGANLPDPYGLLQGDGRQVRYLVFRPGGARPTPDDLVEYLDLALGG